MCKCVFCVIKVWCLIVVVVDLLHIIIVSCERESKCLCFSIYVIDKKKVKQKKNKFDHLNRKFKKNKLTKNKYENRSRASECRNERSKSRIGSKMRIKGGVFERQVE